MRNLEIYGVQELNAKEIMQTQGGNWFLQGLAIRFAYEVVADWEANVAAFNENFNAASQN